MEKPISVGDLVVVVRWPCCGRWLGSHGAVAELHTLKFGLFECTGCDATHKTKVAAKIGDLNGRLCWADSSWLKRIPPLADLDGKKDAADKPITLDGQIERLRKMVSA